MGKSPLLQDAFSLSKMAMALVDANPALRDTLAAPMMMAVMGYWLSQVHSRLNHAVLLMNWDARGLSCSRCHPIFRHVHGSGFPGRQQISQPRKRAISCLNGCRLGCKVALACHLNRARSRHVLIETVLSSAHM